MLRVLVARSPSIHAYGKESWGELPGLGGVKALPHVDLARSDRCA